MCTDCVKLSTVEYNGGIPGILKWIKCIKSLHRGALLGKTSMFYFIHFCVVLILPWACITFFKKFSWLSHMACGMLVPQQELNPCPLHWKHRVLTTGLPGKSWACITFIISRWQRYFHIREEKKKTLQKPASFHGSKCWFSTSEPLPLSLTWPQIFCQMVMILLMSQGYCVT